MKLTVNLLGLTLALILICTVHAEQLELPYNGVVTATRVNLRIAPNLSAEVITSLSYNTEITVLEDAEEWLKVQLTDGNLGWIAKQYVSTYHNEINSRGLGRFGLIDYAKKFLNSSYSYGGSTPAGFDCSGFTRYVYAKYGYQLPHKSAEQMVVGIPIGKDNLRPADLLFFTTHSSKTVNHVGIYIGNQKFIHAASSSGRVRISSLDESYYQKRFISARRILNDFSLEEQIK